MHCYLSQASFQLEKCGSDVDTAKATVKLTGVSGELPCDVKWSNKTATCTFTPQDTGEHKVHTCIHFFLIFL